MADPGTDALRVASKIRSKDYVRTPSSFLKFREALRHAAKGGEISDLDEINEHFGRLTPEGSGYQGPEGKPNTVNLPDIGRVEAKPIPEIEQASVPFLKGQKPLTRFAPFNEVFAAKVANAFDRMRNKPHDPKVKRAYEALIDETLQQYRAAKAAGFDFKFLRHGEADPYAKSPSLGYADLMNKGKLHVFPTEQGYGQFGMEEADNPLLKRVGKIGDLPNATANDAFRVVHDVFGHHGPGNPFFRAPGEERAYQLHSRMYSPEAQKAAASELRGQNSWVNYGPHGAKNRKASGADTIYAPQKAGILPPWARRTEKARGGVAEEPGAYEPEAEPRISDVIKRGVAIAPRMMPTPEEIAHAKADTRTGGDIVNKRLGIIVPEHKRVAGGTYTPGAPGGGRWADMVVKREYMHPPNDRFELTEAPWVKHHTYEKLTDLPGAGFKTSDAELHKLWQEAVEESSAAAKEAVRKHKVRPTFGAEDWHKAMSLPLRDHLWYELSGEKMAENLPDLTPAEHMRMLDILGATSARAKPDENLERTLGTLSQHLRRKPVDVDLTIPSTVRQALAREGQESSALPGNKTGHFSDTLALAGGIPTRFPISVNDVWVGKMFGVPDDVMSSNQSLHEPMAGYFNKIRDLYNERHQGETHFPYQSWNFQAPAWVHLRNQSGEEQGDAYHQVWGKMIKKLQDAGVPGIEGEKITREALMHPGFADALRRTTKPFRDAPKATVEFGTTRNPTGKRAAENFQKALENDDKVSQHEYHKALTSAMYASARGKLHPWDRLKKAITGQLGNESDITRIAHPTSEAPLDIGGTFQGKVSPNIRIPLKDMDPDQIEMFNAVAGRHLKQDAMASSVFHGAEHESEPRPGHTRGHSVFVPTTEQIHPDDIRQFAQELAPHGHDMSYQRHPNGYQFDITPAYTENGAVGVPKKLLDEAYGRALRGRYGPGELYAHDYKSNYTEAGDYAKWRAKLTKRIRDEYFDQAAERGISRGDAKRALEAPEGVRPLPGKKARDVYRARIEHLLEAEKAFRDINQKVTAAHGEFNRRAEARFAKHARRKLSEFEQIPSQPTNFGRDDVPFKRGGRVNHDPTEAQKEAGNYAKHHLVVQGIPIAIENRKGSTRSGVADGKRWSVTMPADYGYIKRTEGADGDHVDVYVGPDRASPLAFIVNQHDHRSGKFDEHKVILGVRSEKEAHKLYCAGFSDGHGPDRVGSLEPISIDGLKRWLKTGKTDKRATTSALVKHALDIAAGAEA